MVGLPVSMLFWEMKQLGIDFAGREVMFKAYIFHLDGTLADTVESIAYVANTVLGEFGYRPLRRRNFTITVARVAES